ncbi:MAG: hypothetical protein U0132_16220 [Gemmatimonadaceae bacterium]
MRRRPSVQKAFDEVRFGPTRILNLRDGLPSGAEAVRRAEGWLRAKQVERAGEVLVVTGRGNGSLDGIAVVKSSIERLITRLRHQGVIGAVREHTPGSFVVTIAPLRMLFEAAARQRGLRSAPAPSAPTSVSAGWRALDPVTRENLQRLAARSIESLGVQAPTEAMIQSEMERQFDLLTRHVGANELSEAALSAALVRALEEYEEG